MTVPATLVLLAYKQAPFVREAVYGAFAQDYRPLEIIFSDDASSDGTFDVMAEEVRRYAGPHETRVNRNQARLGSAEHLAKVVAMARGGLVIMAHGDDVSVPGRVRTIVERQRAEQVSLVSSNANYMDARNCLHGTVSRWTESRTIEAAQIIDEGCTLELLGATLAFERAVIEQFPPLTRATLATGLDQVLPLRAAALRGVYYVAAPLVMYRRHQTNMSNFVVDRTGTQQTFEESCAAQDLTARMRALDDLRALAEQRPRDRALGEIRDRLERRVLRDTARWASLRCELHAAGQRPTWVDADAMASRRIKRRFSTRWWQYDREPLLDKVRRRIDRLVHAKRDTSGA